MGKREREITYNAGFSGISVSGSVTKETKLDESFFVLLDFDVWPPSDPVVVSFLPVIKPVSCSTSMLSGSCRCVCVCVYMYVWSSLFTVFVNVELEESTASSYLHRTHFVAQQLQTVYGTIETFACLYNIHSAMRYSGNYHSNKVTDNTIFRSIHYNFSCYQQ